MESTVNAFLSMQNALNQRRVQLNELKNAATTRSWMMSGNEKTGTEPTYDIKKVDKKLSDINKALFKLDSGIKETNAKTSMKIDIDFDALMSKIE
jgi:hypothetical protein